MKKHLLLIGFVLTACWCRAQQHAPAARVIIGTRTISMSHEGDKETLELPIVSNKYPALKIALGDTVLLYGNTAAKNKKDFEQKGFGVTSLSYKITHQDARVLSIIFYYETMGAHPDTYKTFATYNVVTGKPYPVSAELSKDGLKQIYTRLKDSLKRNAIGLKQELDADSSLQQEDKTSITDTYQDAAAHIQQTELLSSYVFTKAGISFITYDLLPHYIHNLEPNHEWLILYNTVKRYKLKTARVIP